MWIWTPNQWNATLLAASYDFLCSLSHCSTRAYRWPCVVIAACNGVLKRGRRGLVFINTDVLLNLLNLNIFFWKLLLSDPLLSMAFHDAVWHFIWLHSSFNRIKWSVLGILRCREDHNCPLAWSLGVRAKSMTTNMYIPGQLQDSVTATMPFAT